MAADSSSRPSLAALVALLAGALSGTILGTGSGPAVAPVPAQVVAPTKTPTGANSAPYGSMGAWLIAETLGDSSRAALFLDLTPCGRAAGLPTATLGVNAGCAHPSTRDSSRVSIDTVLNVTVATVPDPVDSHADWAYDGALEALRRAYEQAGYVVARMWLPWSHPADSVFADSMRIPARQSFPGVLVFRRADTGAATRKKPWLQVLFLVGEVPTAGVHPRALLSALHQRDALLQLADSAAAWRDTERGDTLRVIGPFYSGSSTGLARILARWSSHGRPVRVITGSATSPANRTIFGDQGIGYGATVVSDSDVVRVLIDSVLPTLQIRPGELALLSEGSTFGYSLARQAEGEGGTPGNGASATDRDSTHRPLVMSFPLSIGSLREAYQAQHAAPALGRSADGGHVQVSLSDPARPMEAPAPSSPLTLAQIDRMFNQFARMLRSRHVRAVLIGASDVRDRLFLAIELQQRVRDIRFFVVGSNELYTSPEYHSALRGTVVISTYPLIGETQLWRGNGRGGVLPFASEGSVGIYNAALLQLDMQERMVDYYRFADGRGRVPMLWLTAVGSNALMPLRAILPTTGYVDSAGGGRVQPAVQIHRDFLVVFAYLALCAIGAFLLLDVVRRMRRLRKEGATELRKMCTPVRRESHLLPKGSSSGTIQAGGREAREPCGHSWRIRVFRHARWGSLRQQEEMYRLLRAVAFFAGVTPPAVQFAAAILQPGGTSSNLAAAIPGAAVALSLATLVVAALNLARWWVRYRYAFRRRYRLKTGETPDMWRVNAWMRSGVLVLAAVYLALTLAFTVEGVLRARNDPLGFTLFFYRSIQLDGGLSPLVPILLGAATFYAWSTWHLRRLSSLRCMTTFEAACLSRFPAAGLKDVDMEDDDVPVDGRSPG